VSALFVGGALGTAPSEGGVDAAPALLVEELCVFFES